MNKFYLSLAIVIGVLITTAQAATSSESDYYDIGARFAKCSGMYLAVSDLMQESQTPAEATVARKLHQDWHTSAIIVFASLNTPKHTYEDLESVVSDFENSAYAEVGMILEFESDTKNLEKLGFQCMQLKGVQENLVAAYRAFISDQTSFGSISSTTN